MAIAVLLALIAAGIYRSRQTEAVLCRGCNVILISVDALRMDSLGIYGYKRNTSPNIDAFFKRGAVFQNVFSQSPITLPSHMSIFTGLYPSRHNVIYLDDEPLSDQRRTLTEILALYDYEGRAYQSGAEHLGPKFGFGRGFAEYKTQNPVYSAKPLFDSLGQLASKRFFMFIHSAAGTHDPYLTRSPHDTMFDPTYRGSIVGNIDEFNRLRRENNISFSLMDYSRVRSLFWSYVDKSDPRDIGHLKALYDGGIRQFDAFFGKLVEQLRGLGLLKNTVIVLTADHGEEFGEHGGFLHEKLYDETLRVPLLIYIPGAKPRVIVNQVGSIDIMPTILEILGIQPPQDIDGVGLKSFIEIPRASEPNSVLFAEWPPFRALRTTDWKLIKKTRTAQNISYELYDLRTDPGEEVNLASGGLPQEEVLKRALAAWEERVKASTTVNPEFLKAPFIGYPP